MRVGEKRDGAKKSEVQEEIKPEEDLQSLYPCDLSLVQGKVTRQG